jgi:hypothetical protein
MCSDVVAAALGLLVGWGLAMIGFWWYERGRR